MDINQKHLPGSRGRFPSFSSSLLDSIDRSIDDDARMDRAAAAAARRKPITDDFEHLREDLITFRRSFAAEKPAQRRRSVPNWGTLSEYDFETTDAANHPRPKPIRTEKKKTMVIKKKKVVMKSPQSGSGERMFVDAASPLGDGLCVSKPMATAKQIQSRSSEEQQLPPKASREGRFKRTKSKAMKMYGDMKRLNQQPISPGARIASFLNSLFHPGDSKKSSKPCPVDPTPPSRPKSPKPSFPFSSSSSSSSSSASTCSSSVSSMAELRSLSQNSKPSTTASTTSSSSLSKMDRKSNASASTAITNTTSLSSSSTSSCSSLTRSCLRNSPRGYRFGGGDSGCDVGGGGVGAKRCVRFSPVSVIIDEDGGCDSRSSGRKSRCESDPGLTPTPILRTRNRAVQVESPTARNSHGLRNNQKKDRRHQDRRGGDDEMDEDTISFSSSDLFELDFLIGFERYREELPVYETTNLHTNHAIANAFHC